MWFCRMGWTRCICLPEGLSGVFLPQGEVRCSCWQVQSFLIPDLHGCRQRRNLDIQRWPNWRECGDMGSLPCQGNHTTNCCGSSQLYGVEGWGLSSLVKRMGSIISRGWPVQKIAGGGLSLSLSLWFFILLSWSFEIFPPPVWIGKISGNKVLRVLVACMFFFSGGKQLFLG